MPDLVAILRIHEIAQVEAVCHDIAYSILERRVGSSPHPVIMSAFLRVLTLTERKKEKSSSSKE